VLITAPSLPAFKQGVAMTRKRGTCVLVGLPPGSFPLEIFGLVAGAVTVRGSFVGTRKDMAECLDFAAKGKVKADIELRRSPRSTRSSSGWNTATSRRGSCSTSPTRKLKRPAKTRMRFDPTPSWPDTSPAQSAAMWGRLGDVLDARRSSATFQPIISNMGQTGLETEHAPNLPASFHRCAVRAG
jgi:hypothetical protein